MWSLLAISYVLMSSESVLRKVRLVLGPCGWMWIWGIVPAPKRYGGWDLILHLCLGRDQLDYGVLAARCCFLVTTCMHVARLVLSRLHGFVC